MAEQIIDWDQNMAKIDGSALVITGSVNTTATTTTSGSTYIVGSHVDSEIWGRNEGGSIALVTYNIGPAGAVTTPGSTYIVGSPSGIMANVEGSALVTTGSHHLASSLPAGTNILGSVIIPAVTGSVGVSNVKGGSVFTTEGSIRYLPGELGSVNVTNLDSLDGSVHVTGGENLLGSMVSQITDTGSLLDLTKEGDAYTLSDKVEMPVVPAICSANTRAHLGVSCTVNRNLNSRIGSAANYAKVDGGRLFTAGSIETLPTTPAGTNIIGSVIIQEPLTIDGTVTSNQGGAPWTQTGSSYLLGTGSVQGNVVHDSADSGAPVKTGGKATDYEPDSSDQPSGNKGEVAASDRSDAAFNRYGEQIEGVNPYFFTLDNVSTTYNGGTTTATSTGKECWNYRWATIGFELDKSNTPTDIAFDVEVSMDGTNYVKYMWGPLCSWLYSDTTVGLGLDICLTFPIACQKIRLKVTTTGTDETNTFTVTNAKLYLRN